MKLSATLLFLFFSQLAFGWWEYLGLGTTNTTDLTVYQDTMYASTYDGIYKASINNMGVWDPCGMQGRHVVQTIAADYQTFICLVEIDSSTRTQIYKSTDGGANFNLLKSDTSAPSYPFLKLMAHPENNFDTIYFLNHLTKTYDGGLTWDTIIRPAQADRCIAVNKINHNEIFVGGENMIFSPSMLSSPDRGDSWTLPAMNNFFAGDNAIHDFSFAPYFGYDTLYAAGEGVVCRSIDGGNNWDQLVNYWSGPADFSLYFWDIESGIYGLYVTGSNTNINTVPLIWAYEYGPFWDTLSTASFDGGESQITCMAVLQAPFGEDVYLGGHGIYCYHIIIGEVDERMKNNVSIYPNPVHDELNINCGDNFLKNSTVSIFNSSARLIEQRTIRTRDIKFEMKNYPPGLYSIQIVSGNGTFYSNRIIKE